MVDLWCQDADWVGGRDRDILDDILPQDGFILATLSMDEGKCGYLGCIFGWFWALGSQLVELGCQGTDWVGGNDRF